jgi:serine/threonine protein kinase
MDERYYVEQVLGGFGSSGMGIVYVVRDGDRRYAAKTFQHQFSQDITLIERFMREAQTWMLIGFHPHIVRPYFLDIIAAVPYLFMEYVDTDHMSRRSLADYLAYGPLPLEGALDFAIQCSAGMAHATAVVPGLVHRDLKPENLLINGDLVLKVTDFGLVHCRGAKDLSKSTTAVAHGDGLTELGAVFGTPAYMAPEQFVESGAVTMAADIYAFGCCFYEALSSKRVFSVEGKTGLERLLAFRQFHQETDPAPLREAAPSCSEELEHLIMKCLRKDPEHRWKTFDEIRDRLTWIYERDFHRRYSPVTADPPSERQVAEQARSLSLLEGYSRAIRLRNLRENQDNSPYAFHLALASYFHSHEEPIEERRQLEKARRVQEGPQGYEVVRRLAELMITNGEKDAAGQLLDDFLAAQPESLDYVLEPYIKLLIARGEFDAAEQTLTRLGASFRTTVLRLQLLRAANRTLELATTLRELATARLPILCGNIALLEAGDVVGWEYQGDWDVLKALLALIAPECDTTPLNIVTHAVWPDLTGVPDFSPDMAYLSQAYGELAELEDIVPPEERAVYAKCAALLGFPNRLARHALRDELWFWTHEGHQNGSGI